jgi:iron complex transport system substrate-binding protein
VSLLASGTEIVCALGAGDSLVGRSHECDNPPWVRDLPPCTEPAFDISVSSGEIDREVKRRIRAAEPLYRIDAARIAQLAPDLVITQAHCDVCAVTPADVERSGCALPSVHQLALSAASVDGIFESMMDVARLLDLEERGRELVACEKRKLEALRQRTQGFARKSVVLFEWTDPIFSMGNWAPELVEIAGGEPLLSHAGTHSTGIEFQRVIEADPEFLIVAPCGFNLHRAWQERLTLAVNRGWEDLRAVRSGSVFFADGNLYFNRSGMTITRTAEIVAEILHGIVTGSPTEGTAWRRAQ